VADVTIVSRPADQPFAAVRRFVDGVAVEAARRSGAPGTQITVRGLFRGVPARLRYLRSPGTETAHVIAIVQHYALARPDVRFTVEVDGRETLRTPGTGALWDAILAVHGREIAEKMIPVDSTEDDSPEATRAVQMTGFISPPEVSRATRAGMSLFINGRWVQNRQLAQAVEAGYHNRLMVGRRPMAVLHYAVPYEGVDVNVHPAKTEVRLLFDREVFGVTQRAIRRALDARLAAPEMTIAAPLVAESDRRRSTPAWTVAEQLPLPTPAAAAPRPDGAPVARSAPPRRVVGQGGLTYIIAEGSDGMYLVDQHAAHERILYDRLCATWAAQTADSQGLLDPLTLELPPEEAEALERVLPALTDLGFAIERFGPATFVARAAPAILRPARLVDALTEAARLIRANPTQWRDSLAATVACHSAVRAGQALSLAEMRALVDDLQPDQKTCPHGRPIMLHLSAAQLEREFGRRG
ncbi:MAG: DNA mismatch repair endonuclease MutL, partial [Dehalococcoidia bacterium]|nr:DNA mismatch repair endonuclease MutL [Dehalococcoidia bacterium]